jgi:hypothetical protein
VSTTTMNSTDLVRFLLARLDEDEAGLKAQRRSAGDGAGPGDGIDRLRTEASAKRQIIGTAQHLLLLRDQPCEKAVRDGASLILRFLAAPYADHPSFRSEWVVTRGH